MDSPTVRRDVERTAAERIERKVKKDERKTEMKETERERGKKRKGLKGRNIIYMLLLAYCF